jgi:hypothetical protein
MLYKPAPSPKKAAVINPPFSTMILLPLVNINDELLVKNKLESKTPAPLDTVNEPVIDVFVLICKPSSSIDAVALPLAILSN